MDRLQPGVEAQLFRRLDRRFAGADAVALGDEAGQIGVPRRQTHRQRVIGRNRDEAGAEQRVRPGREDLDLVAVVLQVEREAQAGRLADPLVLHGPDLVRPAVELGQRVQQLVGIVGDLQDPLVQLPLFDRGAGTPAAPVDHLLVGEHGVFDRVPVDPAFLAVGQTGLQEIQEDLLFVPVVFRRAGRDLARPVIGQTQRLQLGAHGRDVLISPVGGMDLVGDGGVFRRQAEGVPAHGMQHVEAARPLVAGDHVADRVVAGVADMEASRRVREHLQHVVFGTAGVLGRDEATALVPDRLPLSFGFLGIVPRHQTFLTTPRMPIAKGRATSDRDMTVRYW